MPFFPELDDDSQYLSMQDPTELLSRTSPHAFELEGVVWPTVEHYYQAMRFASDEYRESIRQASSTDQAIRMGKTWFKKKRADWKSIEIVVMTRALYIQCKTHPDIAEYLLATDDKKLVENSNYDYFWGCGRDRRGNNHYGKVLMNIRDKLKEENA